MKLDRLHTALEAYPNYTFDYGLDAELALNGDQTYPLLYLEEPILGTVDTDRGFHTLEFAILLLNKDRGNNNGTNYKDNTPWVDESIDEIKPLIAHLEANSYIVNSTSYVTLRDFGSDATSGIRIELSVIDAKKC